MNHEGQLLDKKPERSVLGRAALREKFVKDCAAIASAAGARLLMGVENNECVPPVSQQIPADLSDMLRRETFYHRGGW